MLLKFLWLASLEIWFKYLPTVYLAENILNLLLLTKILWPKIS